MNQDDFRKLLATPRPTAPSSGKNNKSRLPKKNNVFAKPESIKPKPKKKWRKPTEEEAEKPHRDRAKERRQGINPDYEETTQILSMLNNNDDTEVSEKTLTYEQSKYLGGDEKHTHLVKGLDFALLKKVRKEIDMKKSKEQSENEAKAYVENIHGDNQKPEFNSVKAKNIHYWAVEKPKEQLPIKNEMFIAGRMAFVWELGLENGFYVGSSDIPITLQRSKAEIQNYQDKLEVSTNDLVIDKISQIMVNVRLGIRNVQNTSVQDKKKIKKKEKNKKLRQAEVKPIVAMDDDEDIFGDAGRDYELEIDEKKKDKLKSTTEKKIKYFDDDKMDEDEDSTDNVQDSELFKGSKLMEKLMSKKYENDITKDNKKNSNHNESNNDNTTKNTKDDDNSNNNKKTLSTWQSDVAVGPAKPPSFDIENAYPNNDNTKNNEEELGTWQSEVDVGPARPPSMDQEEDYMNGLNAWPSEAAIDSQKSSSSKKKESKSLKPLSNSNDRDNDLDFSDSSDDDENNEADYSQVDLGTNRNKQRQLTRWDFNTEEEWRHYKDTCVILPKAAFQFGVKLSDGRQKGFHHQNSNETKDEKLNRELKQIEKIIDNKYGGGSSHKTSEGKDDNNQDRSNHRSRSRSSSRHRDEKERHRHSSSSSSSHYRSHSSGKHSRTKWDDKDDDNYRKEDRSHHSSKRKRY